MNLQETLNELANKEAKKKKMYAMKTVNIKIDYWKKKNWKFEMEKKNEAKIFV